MRITQIEVRSATFSFLISLLAAPPAAAQPDADALIADSFEQGTDAPDGWTRGAAVPGVEYVYDRRVASDGERSLSLRKTANRYFPIAGWTKRLKHDGTTKKLSVSAKVRASRVTKSVIDVQFLDENDEWINHQWVAYVGAKEANDPPVTHEWKTYEDVVPIPAGTVKLGISLQIYGPGQVWFDELNVRYVDKPTDDKPGNDRSRTNDSPRVGSDRSAPPIEVKLTSGGMARYLLVPPADDASRPESGYPLLLVLPGGDGSAEFHPFVRRIHQHSLDGRFVVAQPLAPPWIVWPTKRSKSRQATTEECVDAIIRDVSRRHDIDPEQVYALAWSSSGPAVYSTLMQPDSPLKGALIAMSVFKPDQLPAAPKLDGRRVYLLHSPDDSVCPYRMAEEAARRLADAGAETKLVEYPGGHGWRGTALDDIRKGMEWLREE